MRWNKLISDRGPERFTPPVYIEAARYVLGAIDLDPASSERANRVVRAAQYYTAADHGLLCPWGGAVFLNPPSWFVRTFWLRACRHALCAGPGAVVLWVGHSLEQLSFLQRGGDIGGARCPAPMDWPHVVLAKNTLESGTTGDASALEAPGIQDPESLSPVEYFCLLGGDSSHRERFRLRFGELGSFSPGRPSLYEQREPRQLESELLETARHHGPLSKRALIRLVRVRSSRGLEAIDELIARGQLVPRGRKLALPEAEKPSEHELGR